MRTKLRALLLIGLFAGSTCKASEVGWYMKAWTYRQKITVATNQVSGTLTNFPIVITHTNVQSGLWVHAQTNANDVVFTDTDGTTKLCHEIEKYDANARQLAVWVKLPVLSSNGTGSVFYLYYGNPAATNQENVTSVWSSNGYLAVWHLKEDAAGTGTVSVYSDSTTNMNFGDDFVSSTGKTGQINGGQEFDGATDYIHAGTSRVLDVNKTFTLSAWIYPHSLSGSGQIVMKGDGGSATERQYELCRYNGYIQFSIMHTNGVLEDLYSAPGVIVASNWQYIAVTKDYLNLTIYCNGGAATNFTLSQDNTHFPATAQPLRIGHFYRQYSAPLRWFDGLMDEVRIADTPRSPAWHATEYNNQNSPSAFAGSSGEELVVHKVTIVSVY